MGTKPRGAYLGAERMLQDHHNPTAPGQPIVDVPLATLVALLGGAPAATVLASRGDALPLAPALDSARAWLTPGTGSSRPSSGIARQFALEVMSLKLRAFTSLCDSLSNSGQLTLTTEQVLGRLSILPGSLMPARWCMRVHLETAAKGDETLTGGPIAPPENDLRRTLGLVLAQCMLSNNERTPAEAEQLARDLATQFTNGAEAVSIDLAEYARNVFARMDARDSSCVLHAAELRAQASGAVTGSLWWSIGELMLRLLADVDGFSFAPNPLAELQPRLAIITHRVDVATFGAQARQDELRTLLQTLAQPNDSAS